MERLLIQLIIGGICGAVAATIASSKKRSAVGWFFAGFFTGLIGIIIVACLSNVRQEQEYRRINDLEKHRLREQLRQERLKNESFRRYSMDRLDAHDRVLGVDTKTPASLPGASSAPAALPGAEPMAADLPVLGNPPGEMTGAVQSTSNSVPVSGGSQGVPVQPPAAWAAEPPPVIQWFFEEGGQARGPVSAETIRHLLSTARLGPRTLLWTEGLSDWTPASQLQDFSPEAAS